MPITAPAHDLSPAFDPAASVFVSANAGAGKTSLLVGRVLSLLLHGVAPSKILCLTFTNAAAGEMVGRVLKELGSWVMMEEGALAATLAALTGHTPDTKLLKRSRGLFAKVLEDPQGLRIQTIHGFCQSLLKRFPIEAGVSPHFTVMDSRTEQEMLAEARIRLFNKARESDSLVQSSLRALAHQLSESSFNDLMQEIIRDKRKFRSLFNGDTDPIADLWKLSGLKVDTTLATLIADYFAYDEAILCALRTAIVKLRECDSKTDAHTAQALAKWLAVFPSPPAGEGGTRSVTGEGTQRKGQPLHPNLPPQGGKESQAIDYTLSYFTDKGTPRKSMFTKAFKDEALAQQLLAERERALRFYEASTTLEITRHTADILHIAEALLSLYEAIKRGHARMDYDDLILSACNLLKRSGMAAWVLFKLDGGIDHILVDEAQDTSAEQWTIIDALTQEFFAGDSRKDIDRSLFIVGDEKQSIFSFQGADPANLGRMQTYFKKRITDAAVPVNAINLIHSFRSTREVLSAVDAIFTREQARAGIMFSDNELNHIPTKEHAGLVELWPLTKPSDEGAYPIAATTILVNHMADTISGWLKKGEQLAGGRTIQPGDIMILVRTRTAFVDRLTRALKRRNIPVAGHDRMALNDNLAVQDLIALGQCLLLPEDDLTLAAFLKSPILGVTEEQLFELAWGRGKLSLWERLRQSSTLAPALELLEDLRARADFTPPFELYSYLLDTRGARRRFTGRMGEEYADPIDEFLNQILLYESAHPPSLQGFIHWLTHSESEIKRDMEQAQNCVRIMTVHGAKGLQAPIVFLPDTTELPKLRSSLLWHERSDTPALPIRGAGRLNERAQALREKERQAMLAEHRRLFYVALTRAEDRLYICGALSRGEEANEESWYHHARAGLAAIAQATEEGGLRLGKVPLSNSPPLRGREDKESPLPEGGRAREGAFSFLTTPTPHEPTPPQPLAPSRLPGDEPANTSPLSDATLYQRGNVIHALLQHLPNIPPPERETAARRIAALRTQSMKPNDIDSCIAEALAILNDPKFALVFGEGSLAEVPVTGCVQWEGKTVAVSGQIDRLYIGKDEVWIVDFKSNRQPPARISAMYLRQLSLYRLVLQAIYPKKTIRCALLWTAAARMTILDEALVAT